MDARQSPTALFPITRTHKDDHVTDRNDVPPATEFARLVSEILPGLKQSAGGIEIAGQLDRALAEHAAILHMVEVGFAQFLDTLFRQFSRRSDLDESARTKLKLIERRLAPYLAAAIAPESPGASNLEAQVASMLWAARADADRRTKSGSETGPAEAPPPPAAPTRGVDDARVLQTLGRVLGGAVGTSADAIADLEMLRRTASGDDAEVPDLRAFMVAATQELIGGYRALHAQLRGAHTAIKVLERRGELSPPAAASGAPAGTGLPSRDALMQRLSVETARVQRFGGNLTLAILHPDRLEQIDAYVGHMGAEEVVRCYARDLLMNFRAYDMVATYNTGTFAVVLPNTGPDQALLALAKLKNRISATRYRVGGKDLAAPTFSTGLASWRPGETPAHLATRADSALERAKLAGPNRVETARLDVVPGRAG
jgi:diguanylate cyclase (GGDEF)-like protein